ncbi:unnamed protein product [Calypogeia fissa]
MAAARQDSRQDGRQDSRQDDGANNRRRPAASDVEDERDAKRTKLRVVLNPADCNLDFNVNGNGLAGSALHETGFGYCWSGARANLGVLSGRYCFGCKITGIQKVDMPDTADDQKNLCRLGISRGDSDVACLGESKNSFGYGGSGKFSTGSNFKDYGDKFTVGDTIVCFVDLESKSMAKISFSKNGKSFGVAKEFDAGPGGVGVTEPVSGQGLPWSRALFPHVLLKNVTVQMQFSVSDGLVPTQGYKAWDTAVEDGLSMEGPRTGNKAECEVLMMVGLPASGKTTWAENWSRDHPDKRYVILGTNLALDQMKVPGLQRKQNYAQRWDLLMSRATEIFNTLLERAASTPRNYIIDQTNVYLSARKRKLRPFSMFRKIAVVVVPRAEEHARRTTARAKDSGSVPVEAVNEMKANFVLPKSKDMAKSDEPFDEVWFVETQRQEAEKILLKDKASVPKPGPRQGQHNFGPGRAHGQPGSFSGEPWGGAGQFQRGGHLPLPISQGYGQALLGSPDQLLGARGEMLGQRVDAIGPRGELLGSRGEILGQRGEFFGQRGELLHQRGDFIGQRGEVYGPRGELIGLRGDLIGPRGEPLIPRGDLMVPRGDLMGQRGEPIGQRDLAGQRGDLLGQRELMGQRGDIGPRGDMIIGPRGELLGQRGELIGQRGELIGPRGEIFGQRGDPLVQRGELIGQRGMHIQTANGLPLSPYDTLNSLSPTMNLPRSGYDSMNLTSGLSRSGFDAINPATGLPRPGFDGGNAGMGGQRSAYDGLNSINGLPKSSYDSGNHAGLIPRSAYDIVGPGGGLPHGSYDGMGSAGGLSRSPYDAFNPNGYSHGISSGAGGDYGGGPIPRVQSPGHRGPLLPLPTQQPSRQHYY